MPAKLDKNQEGKKPVTSLSMEISLFKKWKWFISQKNQTLSQYIRNIAIKDLNAEDQYQVEE